MKEEFYIVKSGVVECRTDGEKVVLKRFDYFREREVKESNVVVIEDIELLSLDKSSFEEDLGARPLFSTAFFLPLSSFSCCPKTLEELMLCPHQKLTEGMCHPCLDPTLGLKCPPHSAMISSFFKALWEAFLPPSLSRTRKTGRNV